MRRSLELSLSLAKAGFKEKNEGSYLGVFWYLLNPLLLFLLLLLVFSDRVGAGIPKYPLYLFLGIILFNFFQRATTESTKTMHENRFLVKSINFPKEILLSAIVVKGLFSHLFEIILFMVLALLFKGSVAGVILYPIVLVFFCIFIYGATLILSSAAVYFVDLENIWEFLSRLIWLATPIFYAIGGQNRLLFISLFNPMYYFITVARDILVYGKMPQLWVVIGMIIYSLLSLAIGSFIFNKLKPRFTEMV